MIKVSDIIKVMDRHIPLSIQEKWDNSGLQVGRTDMEVKGVLCAVDVTEDILLEALSRGCNMVITHHPLLFHPLKRIDESAYISRCVMFAIKNDIAIYAAHTNADNSPIGLNKMLADELGLVDTQVIQPLDEQLIELHTYVPLEYVDRVKVALWKAGAGCIGNYDSCSFSIVGNGTFRALPGANPFVGAIDELHKEQEVKLTVVLPRRSQLAITKALIQSHPYEEPAYTFSPMLNTLKDTGSGIIGNLVKSQESKQYLKKLKDFFQTGRLAHSTVAIDKVKRIAICSGAGAFLWKQAKAMGADLFLTGEAKYNDYYDVENRPILVTVGHYESELISVQLFCNIIRDNFSNFAVCASRIDTNPVKYI